MRVQRKKMNQLIKKLSFALLTLTFSLPLFTFAAAEKTRDEILREQSQAQLEQCQRFADLFYHLEEGEELKEITEDILNSSETKDSIKQKILSSGRRFFLFKYPSDGLQVKGTISFTPNHSQNPLLIFLRGGNRIFGLMHPATRHTCVRDYTVMATTYRGGVSEGRDEFGGSEVNDVNNLLHYFPTLQAKLGIAFTPNKIFMLGGSRGGMEMFLALGRTPQLQNQIDKAASLSGLLDMHECIYYREDMKNMFIEDFGLIPHVNEEEWIKQRNPLEAVPKIRNDLPFLILQGTNDIRVSLQEGYNMVKKLQENGNPVTYLEFPGGDHCLNNQPNLMDLIADWFEG